MIKSKNFILYSTIAVLVVFTVVYFAVANHISYAFTYDESSLLYESKLNLINSCAKIYGQKNLNLFENKETIYITVNDLVKAGLIETDDENGNVKDPRSEVKTFNDLKIRLTYKDEKMTAKVLTN